ncbi:MAG: excinuclease ABC subunit UvrC [archaeon]|jgi:excinuclease ABC subunit C
MTIDFSKLPSNPGCYLFKEVTGIIIYVGKAKNLKKRVSSYFLNKDQGAKTSALVSNISTIDFIITNNELEAFILENTLIKKHLPKYNIDLKSGQRYAYVQITKDSFPRLAILREKPNGKEENVFGPFVSGQSRTELVRYLNKKFKLRTCKRLPKTPCTRYHIGYCTGPCIGKITKEEYSNTIENVKKILQGKSSELAISLKKEMSSYSKNQDFEKALTLRDQINAIEYISQKQTMERQLKFDQDIINFIIKDNKIYLLLFNIDKGTLVNKKEFTFDNSLVDISVIDDFLIKYYGNSNNEIPKELILPVIPEKGTKDYLEKIKSEKIIFTIPQKGEKKELLDLCLKNIEATFFKDELVLIDLQKKLSLKFLPRVIECFDISHLSGTGTVGSMVSFKDGQPHKANYRRFKINTLDKGKIDDFKAIAEVVKRRYSRLLKENISFPDLIIIDGGKGQLSSAVSVLKELDVLNKVEIISLAKREEEVFRPDYLFPIKLNKKDPALHLLQRIRDEAHRFAITYNRLLRKKEIRKS